DLGEEEFLRRGVDQFDLVRVEPRPLGCPFERDDQRVEQALGEEEAHQEGDEKAPDRPDQPAAQFDEMLHERSCRFLDLVLFVNAHLAVPAVFFFVAAGFSAAGADLAATFAGAALAGVDLAGAAFSETVLAGVALTGAGLAALGAAAFAVFFGAGVFTGW